MRQRLPRIDPVCRARWFDQACQSPMNKRLPLLMGRVVVGSVAANFVQFLNDLNLKLDWSLSHDKDELVHLPADPSITFSRIRQALQQQGLLVWPQVERLPLLDAQGKVLGAVSRDLVRLLGINTHSVHLVGWQGDACWVQERAANKTEDPGRLDTLVGGTVAWEEDPSATLERETWEEAGLSLKQLNKVTSFGSIELNRPSGDARGWGHTWETIHCLSAELDARAEPVNQDGEVAAFYRFEWEELNHALEAERFTLAATGVFLRVTQSSPLTQPSRYPA